jgi:uncharacterized RDD family membrane protein YckC
MSDVPPPRSPPPPDQPPAYQPPAYQPPAYQPPAYQPPGHAQAGSSTTYAGFWSRVAARLIDWLIGLLFSLPGIAFIVAAATQTEENADGETEFTDTGAALLGIGVLLVVVGGLLFLILWMRKLGRGQSWGQKAVGISLVSKANGRPVGAWKAFGRYLVAQLVSGALFGLGYLWMLWDHDKQTWHDKILNTVVVEV